MAKDELEDFVMSQGAPKTAGEDPRSDAEIDKLLGLEFQGEDRHTWPRSALGVDSAGREATAEEKAKQQLVYDNDKTP